MKKIILSIISAFLISLLPHINVIIAQETISWLEEFTGDITVGSYTFNYNYTAAEDNTCKLRIEEKKTNKKGKIFTKAYEFYLSDLDLSALVFKTSGNNAVVSMEIKQSQKFILEYAEGELSGYTNSITVSMSEVDKARSFIDAIKRNAQECKETDKSWTTNKETLDWLSQNVGESTASGTSYKQAFSQTDKEYMVQLVSESTDSKGTQKTITYDLNLSDIDPDKVNLAVSGKYFKIVLPTRENKYYIRLKQDNDKYSYAKNLEIYSDEIELARNQFNALLFLANNSAIPERKAWNSYPDAIQFVKNNLGTVQVGTSIIAQSLSFDESPSGMVHFSIEKTDSKGTSTITTNSFYLSDLQPEISLSASSRNISFELQIKDKNKYIRQSGEANALPYSSTLEIYDSNIETARELINALENAIDKSENGLLEFTGTEKSMAWLSDNVGDVKIDATTYSQSMKIAPENENKMELSIATSIEGGESSSELFEIYPEDLSLDNLVIKVSGKKMMVPLSTGKLKYIKTHENEALQNFVSKAEVLFDDVQKARNFISAIKILQENSQLKNRLMKDREAAMAFLDENIREIELEGKTAQQKIEIRDNDDCKLSFTRKETDSKGVEIEYLYEFTMTDIDPDGSQISVSMNKLMIDLITKDKEKLIKPYKNGEEGNFVNSIEIQVDDVLVAKKILGAFATLSKVCE